MTEQEAIEIMEEVKSLDDSLYAYDPAYMEALEIAISASKEVQRYRKIGTVEECREDREKKTPKKCDIEVLPDYIYYKCPTCMAVHMTFYKPNGPKTGEIPKFCKWCGQAIENVKMRFWRGSAFLP